MSENRYKVRYAVPGRLHKGVGVCGGGGCYFKRDVTRGFYGVKTSTPLVWFYHSHQMGDQKCDIISYITVRTLTS